MTASQTTKMVKKNQGPEPVTLVLLEKSRMRGGLRKKREDECEGK